MQRCYRFPEDCSPAARNYALRTMMHHITLAQRDRVKDLDGVDEGDYQITSPLGTTIHKVREGRMIITTQGYPHTGAEYHAAMQLMLSPRLKQPKSVDGHVYYSYEPAKVETAGEGGLPDMGKFVAGCMESIHAFLKRKSPLTDDIHLHDPVMKSTRRN